MNAQNQKVNWEEFLEETPQMDYSSLEVRQFIETIPVYSDSIQQVVADRKSVV